MSLRPAAEAPVATVGAPVRLGGEPSRLHLVLRAGQAAETSGAKELAKKVAEEAAAKFDAALKAALKAAAKSRNLATVKRMLKITSKSTIADIRTKLQPWQDWLQSQLKNDDQKAKFQRAVQKLQRMSTSTLPPGCNWDAYVAEKDACKGLTKAQEDELYNKMSDQRDKENYIFSVFLYLLRIAFMLD